MVDVDGVTYEQDFKTEAAIDEALSYLRDSGKNKTVYAVRYQTDRTYCFVLPIVLCRLYVKLVLIGEH